MSPARLAAVRLTMLAGVLVFGGVAWAVRRAADAPLPGGAPALRVTGLVIGAAAIVGIAAMRWLRDGTADAGRRATYSIVAWACGEVAALFGAVHYFMTGSPRPYTTGVLLLVASFVFLPLPRAEGAR